MFNILVSGNDETWEKTEWILERDRYLQYTDEEFHDSFKPLSLPEWSIEAVEQGMYLKGVQETPMSFGKMVFMCGERGTITLLSVYAAGKRAEEIAGMGNYNTLKIDDSNYPLPEGERFIRDGFINNVHHLPESYFGKIMAAGSVGYSMQVLEDSPTFWGFDIEVGNERNRGMIVNYLKNCTKKKPS